MTPTHQLRTLLASGECHIGPGVFDGLSARVAEAAGLPFAHASGGAIARSIGYPDIGLVTMTEMLVRIREMTEAVRIPVVADADTGYGNAHNAARAARAFREAGVAALHVEDQGFPKKCGHYDDLELIPAAEMCGKLRAMKDAVGDDLVLIARTDAVKVEGLDGALERMNTYLAAGADVAFIEALDTADMIRTAGVIDAPKFINQSASSSGLPLGLPELARLGFALAVYPSDLQRACIHAMDELAAELRRSGDSVALHDRLASGARRDALVGAERYD